MGDEEEARAGVADEGEEEGDDGVAGRLVEAAGGLVGEEERRAGGEGAADRDALLLAAGELLGVAGEKRLEAEAAGELGLPGGVEAAGEAGLEGEVGGDVEARDQVELLEDEADRLAAEAGARGVGERRSTSWPSMRMAPESARSRPATRWRRVDLPLPDSPVRARERPEGSVRETPARTGSGPCAVG